MRDALVKNLCFHSDPKSEAWIQLERQRMVSMIRRKIGLETNWHRKYDKNNKSTKEKTRILSMYSGADKFDGSFLN